MGENVLLWRRSEIIPGLRLEDGQSTSCWPCTCSALQSGSGNSEISRKKILTLIHPMRNSIRSLSLGTSFFFRFFAWKKLECGSFAVVARLQQGRSEDRLSVQPLSLSGRYFAAWNLVTASLLYRYNYPRYESCVCSPGLSKAWTTGIFSRYTLHTLYRF
jgi:hypothetical protein